jgi:hypothetical protein
MGVNGIVRKAAAALAVVALAACTQALPVVTPSPTDAFLVPQGQEATGPIAPLSEGDAFESTWRYGIYPTDDGHCLQLDLDGRVGARCDGLLPEGDAALGSIGVVTSETTGATFVEGIATESVATVWLIAADQSRAPALLVPLAESGVDGQAFLGAATSETELTHVMAVAFNGEVLDTYELP